MNNERTLALRPVSTPDAKEITDYIKNGAGYCPFCRSHNISAENPQSEDVTAWQEVSCADCRSEWQDVFELRSVAIADDDLGSLVEISADPQALSASAHKAKLQTLYAKIHDAIGSLLDKGITIEAATILGPITFDLSEAIDSLPENTDPQALSEKSK